MGFYAPAQIVRDARLHGVEVRSVCVNASGWDCALEPADGRYLAVRLGLRMAKGLARAHADEIVSRRGAVPYRSVEDMWRRAHVPVAALERLAEADAFGSLGLDRRQALWAIRGLSDARLPLFDTPVSWQMPSEVPRVMADAFGVAPCVMAGLGPATHVFPFRAPQERRGWLGQARP